MLREDGGLQIEDCRFQNTDYNNLRTGWLLFQQSFQMQPHRFRQPVGMVASFEDADEFAAGVRGGDLLDNLSQFGEVFGFELQRASGSWRWASKPALRSTSCGFTREAKSSSSFAKAAR